MLWPKNAIFVNIKGLLRICHLLIFLSHEVVTLQLLLEGYGKKNQLLGYKNCSLNLVSNLPILFI